jgi:hypothetical protein
LAESIPLCICQALAELLRRQLYQAPVSKHLLASSIVYEFGDYMGWILRWDFLCMAFPSVYAPHFVLIFPLDRNFTHLYTVACVMLYKKLDT